MRTFVVLSDIQIPFQDHQSLELVMKFIHDLKPYGVVLNGDIVDNYAISSFDQDPWTQATVEREIHEAGVLMKRLAKYTTIRHWIGGNHEDRWRRQIWKHPKLRGMFASFPHSFALGSYGFTWHPYGGAVRLGKLYITHGSRVSKHSAMSAKAHFDKYGCSVMVGHSHRLGIYYHRNMGGTYAAYENGCLCSLSPEYDTHPDWQQGFAVVHVEDRGGLFHVQQIPILRRHVLFYGPKEYRL